MDKAALQDKPAPTAPDRGREVLRTLVTSAADALTPHVTSDTLRLEHVTPEAFAFAAAVVLEVLERRTPGRRVCLLCPDARTQEALLTGLGVWGTAALFCPRLSPPVDAALPDPDLAAERIAALARWQEAGAPRALLLCVDSLEEEAPDATRLSSRRRRLEPGAELPLETFLAELELAGCERVPVVAERGQFARRGGIVDLFPWHAEEPLRVEWFDDCIESIRAFDLHHQASVRRMDHVDVLLQADDAEATGRVRDHLRPDDLVVEIGTDAGLPAVARVASHPAAGASEDFTTAIHANPLGVFDASDFVLNETRRDQLARQVREWREDGWRVVVVFANEAERDRFTELVPGLKTGPLETALGLLYRGFTLPLARLAVLSGAEIFGRHAPVRRVRGSKLDDPEMLRKARDILRDLNSGDIVVHAEHGVARYGGLEQRTVGGRSEEVLVLNYAEGARFFVPAAQAHQVSRYVGIGGRAPALSKLGGGAWQKTRRSAEKSVEAFAARMLSISAERRSLKGCSHPPDSKWQAEFEDSFLYHETPDQLRCVEEIKRDMESDRPMDRLLCADVGFGKTEVAIRAAFKAVMGGKQAAILVPTTVLARQHWSTLRERMSEFPVTVEMLCRLTPRRREKSILAGLRDGSVDIVVGTHRVISKDVQFKDLGLVVIDEEQRFGVRHKERFKELFRLVDVLTLSATPIPRTLYLGLMGMRDMSTIETPPPCKQAVQTIVCPYDERVIRQAIDAELDRGGQVFFLHNRVMTIEKVAQRIRELCPRARVITGHGQMDEELLEDVMHTFVDGHADVLVCTTIIESGVDIPNANTILIDRADRFGLADLYQLRGRVGRGGALAHAYLMLPREAVTAGDARKRVNAIQQYTGLGSGFKIALRDLEIRGAGNLLGTEQSGHIAAVGFDMYCQMLKQSVARLQGRRVPRPVEVGLRADFLVQSEAHLDGLPGATPAFLPAAFIEDARLRITAYRQLGEVMTRRELDELETQWRDQFGDRLPHAVRNLLTCAAIRLAAAHAGITAVEIKDRKLMLTRHGQLVMPGGKFPRLSERLGHRQLEETLRLLRTL